MYATLYYSDPLFVTMDDPPLTQAEHVLRGSHLSCQIVFGNIMMSDLMDRQSYVNAGGPCHPGDLF